MDSPWYIWGVLQARYYSLCQGGGKNTQLPLLYFAQWQWILQSSWHPFSSCSLPTKLSFLSFPTVFLFFSWEVQLEHFLNIAQMYYLLFRPKAGKAARVPRKHRLLFLKVLSWILIARKMAKGTLCIVSQKTVSCIRWNESYGDLGSNPRTIRRRFTGYGQLHIFRRLRDVVSMDNPLSHRAERQNLSFPCHSINISTFQDSKNTTGSKVRIHKTLKIFLWIKLFT